MTETSSQLPTRDGVSGNLLPRNTTRLPDTTPVIPEGTRGYLAHNPDFGKNDGFYHPPLYFSTNPMDALDPLGRFKLKEVEDVISPGFPD